MFPVTCRNCGELNFFFSLPPERVKCQNCGNYFRTDKGPVSPSGGKSRHQSFKTELETYLDGARNDNQDQLKAASDRLGEIMKAESKNGMKELDRGGNRGCFIATAACGTDQDEDVIRLRDFRDSVLRKTCLGRAFVGIYETVSPPIARIIEKSAAARWLVRHFVVHPTRVLAELYMRSGKQRS